MESQITWEEVQKFTRVRENGTIWRNKSSYYYVTEEGTVASWLAVYDLPEELFLMLEKNEKSESDILYKLRFGSWPITVCGCANPTQLIAQPDLQRKYSAKELEEILPIAEKQWIYWKGSLPQNYISKIEREMGIGEI